MEHQVIRHRHELKRRSLTVRETARITPNMIRILFEGDDPEEVIKSCGHPLAWTKAAGYWLKGAADAHDKLAD